MVENVFDRYPDNITFSEWKAAELKKIALINQWYGICSMCRAVTFSINEDLCRRCESIVQSREEV